MVWRIFLGFGVGVGRGGGQRDLAGGAWRVGSVGEDQCDPDHSIHQQMLEFSGLVKDKLGAAISYRNETYQDHTHVPFPCLYDGLRFVTADQPKQ